MVQASIPAAIARHTLGALASDLATTPFPELACINVAGEALVNGWPWNWLRRQTVPLHLRAYQPWLDLPSDFQSVLSLRPTTGLMSSIGPASLAELEELRGAGVGVQNAYGYLYAIEDAAPENWNLLSATESFQTPWNAGSGVTVTPAQTTSPTGVLNGSRLTPATVADQLEQDVPFAQGLVHGRVFIFSVHLKVGTSQNTDIRIDQQGTSTPPETSSRAPMTTARVTWTGGVGTIAVIAQRGAGVHVAGIEDAGDGWYRAWVALTYDQSDAARPVSEMACAIKPTGVAPLGNVFAWGAQLERVDTPDTGLARPRAYRLNADAPQAQVGESVRRLALYPTPTTDVFHAYALSYRRRWRRVVAESDTIDCPSWLEPLLFDLVIAAARGYHEEDEAGFATRFQEIRKSDLWRDATAQDSSGQVSFGPMRGTAASVPMSGRDWTQGTIVNPPQ